MTGTIWDGFKSRPYDLEAVKAGNAEWAAEYRPKLAERDRRRAEIREAGRKAMASLEPETRAAIEAAYGGPL